MAISLNTRSYIKIMLSKCISLAELFGNELSSFLKEVN